MQIQYSEKTKKSRPLLVLRELRPIKVNTKVQRKHRHQNTEKFSHRNPWCQVVKLLQWKMTSSMNAVFVQH